MPLFQRLKKTGDGKRGLRRLRHRREDADYRPGVTVDFRAARDSLRDVAGVFYLLQLEM